MQTFIDTANNNQPWQLDDDVIVTQDGGVYVFTAAHGARLSLPTTLVPGELPEPAEPQPYIPQSVTPAQGLMALYVLHEITEADIQAAIESIEDAVMRYQATIAFARATVWERASTSMGVVAQLMSLTEANLDAAFTLAATYANL